MALETWNGRTASQTDADSPLDTTLMDGLRKDLDHLRQALYGSTDPNFHTPIWGHNHDGVNSASATVANGAITQAKLANAVVGQAQVKSSTAYIAGSLNADTGVIITMSDYSFFPNIASTFTTGMDILSYYSATNPDSTVGKIKIHNTHATDAYPYWINYRYITASEGQQYFILKNAAQKIVLKYGFEDAPPEYLAVINTVAADNNLTFVKVNKIEFDIAIIEI